MGIVSEILETGSFDMAVPNRSEANQKYIESLDRNVLGKKISKRSFVNISHVRKTAITTRVMQLVHEVLTKGIHITKRDLFYTDVKLFKEQGESDAVLDDVACMVGCTRTSLHVVASDKGLVVGRIQYREAGDYIDCTKMGVGGKAIPPYIDRITEITSDAEFIILVEKEAAYMRLAEDRFYQKHPCIIITGKGQPDVASRLFLRKIRDLLNIPVLALVDSDPYGLKILSVYCSGSKGMSYDSNHLTTPDIKWLGVRPSDLDKYSLPAQCRLAMTEHDRKMGAELLKEPFIQKNPQWVAELELMMRTGEKAEIQALSSFGFQYITETFLPRKLREGDWI
ncbi:SPO11-3 [Symbiodinium microadriaticum]|nr:SPO11-3 [Symbiodinium microadriaticum]